MSPRTTRLLVAAAGLSILHHLDHVLRVDHSGWPFRDAVTPFTFSLLAYPMIALALFGPVRIFRARWWLLFTGTAMTLAAHTLVESPGMQYVMWARNCSLDPAQASVHNLFDIQSPAFGLAAVVVSMSLNALAVFATASMFLDGRRGRHDASG